MKKYRKKPVVIEAMEVTKENIGDLPIKALGTLGQTFDYGVMIDTLEGPLLCRWGDYLIKGVQGEYYPCKPDVFHQTYDEVKDFLNLQEGIRGK